MPPEAPVTTITCGVSEAVFMGSSWTVVDENVRGLDEERVDEGLRQVAAQLALDDVELLGEQPGRSEGATGPLEPPDGAVGVALLVGGQGQVEAAQQEGTLGLVQRPRAVTEAVDVAVVGQVLDHRPPGRYAAGVVGWDRSANRGQQQR